MDRIKSAINKIWSYELSHMFVYSVIINIVMECLNKRSITGLLSIFTSPVIFLMNTMIIMTTMSAAYFFKKRIFVYAVVSVVWMIIAIVNFMVLCSRKTPFTAMDIYLISDAIKVIPLYINVFEMILIAAGVILVIAGLVVLWRKAKEYKPSVTGRKFYIAAIFKCGIVFLLTYSYTAALIINGRVDTHFGNLAHAYQNYGVAYCFTSSIKDRGISKSKEYSQEYMDSLKQDLDETDLDTSDEVSVKTPNIIFVQLESFFDPKLVKGVEFSSNPTPNFDRLRSEYSSGYLSVPCFGAGTANTEFEVQTGVNLDDFGPGEYPYRTVMQSKTCESAAYDLKKIGYATHAIHNNDATFYDRYKVFSHLGYDTFTSIEYMDSDYQKTPLGWAKDKMLVPQIKKTLDSTEGRDYIFTISVQGHGDYPEVMPEGYNTSIKVSNFFNPEEQTQFEYYVNQVHEMDSFIGELVDMLERRKEETVLVMYGDHLPTFSFTDDTMENGDIYQTEYFIWSNIDMEKKDMDLQAYQLSSAVFERLGISEGYIMKFHQTKHNDADYLKQLKILEYDILYGDKQIYNGEIPYVATDLKMGIEDITIDEVYNYKDYVCVAGKNFNDFSKVLINDKETESELISSTMIKIPKKNVVSNDEVAVIQSGEDKIELGRTTYKVP